MTAARITFGVVAESLSGHCCFEASVVMLSEDGKTPTVQKVLCECMYQEDAKVIRDVLEVSTWPLFQDAMRYRWLRAQHWNDSPLAVVANPKQAIKLGHDCPSDERLDELIDSFRLGKPI